jgi:hypothetical protein
LSGGGAAVWVRLSVEKDGGVLANSVYEILSGFDVERAMRDVLHRAIRSRTDQDFRYMTIEEIFDLISDSAIRVERP